MNTKPKIVVSLLLLTFVAWCGLFFLAKLWQEKNPVGEALGYENLRHMGTIPHGTIVSAESVLTNKGDTEITVEDFATSCSCTKVYVRNPMNQKVEVVSLTISPHNSAVVGTDINVSGDVGSLQSNRISFRSPSDDHIQSIIFTYTPVSSLFILPKIVDFGSFYLGEEPSRIVDLKSDGTFADKIIDLKVFGSHSSSIVVELEVSPWSGEETTPDFSDQEISTVGRLKFTIRNLTNMTPFRRNIRLRINDRWDIEVPIQAQPQSKVKFSPEVVILPRISASVVETEAVIICRSFDDIKDFKLISKLPENLSLTIENQTSKTCRLVLKYVGQSVRSNPEQIKQVLLFSCGTSQEIISINLAVITPKNAE